MRPYTYSMSLNASRSFAIPTRVSQKTCSFQLFVFHSFGVTGSFPSRPFCGSKRASKLSSTKNSRGCCSPCA